MMDTPPNSMTSLRRYDIDWLRVIAMWLLIIYHIVVSFQPFGGLIGFIQNNESMEYLWPAFQILNIWRIPLLFFVSGMGVFFAMKNRNWHQLLGERSLRILVPLVYGTFAIAPLHHYIFQYYNGNPLSYFPFPSHLWFLINIYAYVLVFLPLFLFFKKYPENALIRWNRRILSQPITIFLFTALPAVTAVLTDKSNYAAYALSVHGFFVGLVSFFLGFYMVLLGKEFWDALRRTKLALLILAVVLYCLRLLYFGFDKTPNALNGLESAAWIFAIFGYAHQYLNKPSKVLDYLCPAVYPTYIMHMFLQYLGSSFIFKSGLPKELKFLILTLFTFIGCYVLYEVFKRIKYFRPLLGMKL